MDRPRVTELRQFKKAVDSGFNKHMEAWARHILNKSPTLKQTIVMHQALDGIEEKDRVFITFNRSAREALATQWRSLEEINNRFLLDMINMDDQIQDDLIKTQKSVHDFVISRAQVLTIQSRLEQMAGLCMHLTFYEMILKKKINGLKGVYISINKYADQMGYKSSNDIVNRYAALKSVFDEIYADFEMKSNALMEVSEEFNKVMEENIIQHIISHNEIGALREKLRILTEANETAASTLVDASKDTIGFWIKESVHNIYERFREIGKWGEKITTLQKIDFIDYKVKDMTFTIKWILEDMKREALQIVKKERRKSSIKHKPSYSDATTTSTASTLAKQKPSKKYTSVLADLELSEDEDKPLETEKSVSGVLRGIKGSVKEGNRHRIGAIRLKPLPDVKKSTNEEMLKGVSNYENSKTRPRYEGGVRKTFQGSITSSPYTTTQRSLHKEASNKTAQFDKSSKRMSKDIKLEPIYEKTDGALHGYFKTELEDLKVMIENDEMSDLSGNKDELGAKYSFYSTEKFKLNRNSVPKAWRNYWNVSKSVKKQRAKKKKNPVRALSFLGGDNNNNDQRNTNLNRRPIYDDERIPKRSEIIFERNPLQKSKLPLNASHDKALSVTTDKSGYGPTYSLPTQKNDVCQPCVGLPHMINSAGDKEKEKHEKRKRCGLQLRSPNQHPTSSCHGGSLPKLNTNKAVNKTARLSLVYSDKFCLQQHGGTRSINHIGQLPKLNPSVARHEQAKGRGLLDNIHTATSKTSFQQISEKCEARRRLQENCLPMLSNVFMNSAKARLNEKENSV